MKPYFGTDWIEVDDTPIFVDSSKHWTNQIKKRQNKDHMRMRPQTYCLLVQCMLIVLFNTKKER